MNNYPGGYQIVDFNGLTFNGTSTTIKDPKNAEILRTTSKMVIVTGLLNNDASSATLVMTVMSDTGARDGRSYGGVMGKVFVTISTDDDNVTLAFEPII